MASYLTLAGATQAELRVKGSRFIAQLTPQAQRLAAEQFWHRQRSDHTAATHHCFAWRGNRDEFYYSDDGEPSGSAGRPMLQVLQGHDLEQVAAVVVRYFGGTKLGTGGLARAYGGAVSEALRSGKIIRVIPQVCLRLTHAYNQTGLVEQILHQHNAELLQRRFNRQVELTVRLAKTNKELFVSALREGSANRVRIAEEACYE
jgi:uncharacterized YigZ family protein